MLVGSIFDAAAVQQLRSYEIGSEVEVEAGARTQPSPAPPVVLRGVLESLTEGDPDAGGIAVVRVGGIRAVVTEHRKGFNGAEPFEAIGLDPGAADIVVAKAGYLEPSLYALADRADGLHWTLALTPGGVDQQLERLGHHRISRPMFPFDPETRPGGGFEPDLTAVLLSWPAPFDRD